MNTEELLDKIDEAYHKAGPVTFSTVEDALKVAGSALKWLTDQCEDEEDEARREACKKLTEEGQALEKEYGPKDENTD